MGLSAQVGRTLDIAPNTLPQVFADLGLLPLTPIGVVLGISWAVHGGVYAHLPTSRWTWALTHAPRKPGACRPGRGFNHCRTIAERGM
jgi:hypothetical protein